MLFVPAATRPKWGNDANTKLLLHCNGADASTGFTDSSAAARTVTANGSAQVDTAQSKFGGASALFASGANYLSIADAADLRPGTGDFTYDFWVRSSAGSAYQTLFGKGYIAAGDILCQTDNGATPTLYVYASGTAVIVASTPYSLNAWHHVALVRSGTTMKLYLDGVSVGSVSNSTNFNNTLPLIIGGETRSNLLSIIGWLDEFRFSNIARWTATFTPPGAPYW